MGAVRGNCNRSEQPPTNGNHRPGAVFTARADNESPVPFSSVANVSDVPGFVIEANAENVLNPQEREPGEKVGSTSPGENGSPDDEDDSVPGSSDSSLLRAGLLHVSPYMLWTILRTTGMSRLSVKQYMSIRSFVCHIVRHAGGETAILPLYGTLLKFINGQLLPNLCMTCKEIFDDVDMEKTSARFDRISRTGIPQMRMSYTSIALYACADIRVPYLKHGATNMRERCENAEFVRTRPRFWWRATKHP